jgi:hypothetical protein
MGVALFIVPERQVDGVDVFVDGKALARCRPAGTKQRLGRSAGRHLEALAREAGVRPLMEFFSQNLDEAIALIDDAGGEPPPGGLPPEQWFPASEGLATVRGLLDYLTSRPDGAAEIDALVEDLRQFESVLGHLEAAEIGWHLAVDF